MWTLPGPVIDEEAAQLPQCGDQNMVERRPLRFRLSAEIELLIYAAPPSQTGLR